MLNKKTGVSIENLATTLGKISIERKSNITIANITPEFCVSFFILHIIFCVCDSLIREMQPIHTINGWKRQKWLVYVQKIETIALICSL